MSAVNDDERPARLLEMFATEMIVIAILADRIAALEAGADDCLVVPFQRRELLARFDAMHRRTRQPTQLSTV